jgi:hypothetical protein
MRCRNCTETRPRRHRLQRVDHHLLDFVVADRAWPTRTRLVDQPLQPVPECPVTPATCGPSPAPAPYTAHAKDGVETKLKNAVCAGTMPLSGRLQRHQEPLDHGPAGHRNSTDPSTRQGVQATSAGCPAASVEYGLLLCPRAAEQTATLTPEEQRSKPAE